jgi:hypothetical protein
MGISIGLIRNPPAAPGLGVSLVRLRATRPGLVTIDDSEIEMAGLRVAASGTVIIGEGAEGRVFLALWPRRIWSNRRDS